MMYDPAPPVDEALLRRYSKCSSSSLPVHLAASPDDVARLYPAPPTDRPTPSTQITQSAQSTRSAPALKKRSRDDGSGSGSGGGGGGGGDVSADLSAAPSVSASVPSAPHVHYDPPFARTDHMGRSFLEPPPSLQAPRAPLCRVPTQLRGGWGRHAAGVQQLQWVPPLAHLLLAADLRGEVRLYEALGQRRRLATFVAHTQPVKSLETTSDAAVMSTGSVDGTIAMWDLELGTCRGVLTNTENLPCVQHLHHPFDEAALVLAALDRKVVLYDVRASHQRYQREYTGHMGTIFNLTLLSEGKKLLTTAEDKTLRTWDFRVPVQIKQIADVSMHAITHVAHHPTEPMLVAQSLNNQALVFADSGGGQVKLLRHRVFSGHTISGTRCQLAFSPDGRFLSSGDIHGKLFIWSWATGELLRSFTAHSQTLASHLWHPVELSRVATSAWDGTIKNWT